MYKKTKKQTTQQHTIHQPNQHSTREATVLLITMMNRKNNNNEIKEDVPELRSVMMARPAMPPPMSFASMGPPSLKSTHQSAPRAKAAPSSSPLTPAARWQVSTSDLPELEAHYPLGRTNVYVQTSSCQDVADRICNFLKVESIATTPCSDEKALLKAETSTCVKFAIRMFKDQGMTVVEVQRMAGCGFEFSQVAKGVCRSAKGLSSAPKRKLPPLPSSIPRQSPVERIRRIENGIKIALDMLMSPRSDLQLLGLQSLQQITAGASDSASTVGMVLNGEYIVKLVSLIVAKKDAHLLSELEERNFIELQRSALAVLSQCLKAVSQDKLPSILLDVKGVDLTEFVSSLVGFLNGSASSPHEALFATRILQDITSIQEVERVLRELDLHNSIDTACASGAISNLLLETESDKLRAQLL